MSIETPFPRHNQTVDEFRARHITPEEAETGILNDLFQTVVQARIARHVLISRRSSWAKTDDQAKVLAENAIQVGEEFTGWISLPQRVPNYSIPTAASLVEAGHQASIELGERLIEEKKAELTEKYPETEEILKSLLEESAKLTIKQYRPKLNITITDLFTQISKEKIDPFVTQIQQEIRIKEAEAEAINHRQTVNNIFEENKALVIHVVKLLASRIAQSGLDFEDAIAEGNIGLLQAIERFDPKAGNFSSFVVPRIRGAILDAIIQYSPAPSSTLKRATAIFKFEKDFQAQNGRDPSEEEIAEGMKIKLRTLTQTRKIMSINQQSIEGHMNSFSDDPDVNRNLELAETNETMLPEERLLAQENQTEQALKQYAIQLLLEELPSREAKILSMYYFNDMTQSNIAPILGLSEARIAQLKRKGESELAILITGIDLDSNIQGIMTRPTMTLMTCLKDLGVSYATYNAHELGKGIRFKRKNNEGKRGRGPILVNPIQQEMIKIRLKKIGEEKNMSRKKKPTTDHTIPDDLTTLSDFLSEIGISYSTYKKHNLAEGLELSHVPWGRTILLSSDQQSIIKQRLHEVRQTQKKQKEQPNAKQEIPEESVNLSTLLNEIGITYPTYRSYNLSAGLNLIRGPGRSGILLSPEQQAIIKSRYQNREIRKRGAQA